MGGHARIGIDLGGTKIAVMLLGSDGKIAAHDRLDTPKGNYRKTLDSVCRLVMRQEKRGGGDASIGIGIPGSVSSATGLIQNSNSTWLNGQPLEQDLEATLGRQVRRIIDGPRGIGGEWGTIPCHGRRRTNLQENNAVAAGRDAWKPGYRVPACR